MAPPCETVETLVDGMLPEAAVGNLLDKLRHAQGRGDAAEHGNRAPTAEPSCEIFVVPARGLIGYPFG